MEHVSPENGQTSKRNETHSRWPPSRRRKEVCAHQQQQLQQSALAKSLQVSASLVEKQRSRGKVGSLKSLLIADNGVISTWSLSGLAGMSFPESVNNILALGHCKKYRKFYVLFVYRKCIMICFEKLNKQIQTVVQT